MDADLGGGRGWPKEDPTISNAGNLSFKLLPNLPPGHFQPRVVVPHGKAGEYQVSRLISVGCPSIITDAEIQGLHHQS